MIRTACGNVRGAARPRSRSFRRVYDAIRGVGGGVGYYCRINICRDTGPQSGDAKRRVKKGNGNRTVAAGENRNGRISIMNEGWVTRCR